MGYVCVLNYTNFAVLYTAKLVLFSLIHNRIASYPPLSLMRLY